MAASSSLRGTVESSGRRAHPDIVSPMPRDPNIPDAFDVYTLALLRRPANAPDMPDHELDALQARHLAYRAELRQDGLVVANGPLGEQSDSAMRGLSIFACSLDEAARLSDADPLVQAGRLSYDLMEWWVAAGTLAFPAARVAVGDRRVMPDD
jgi:uncharacterized protein YciI